MRYVLLNDKQREVLKPVYEQEFDSVLPPANQANILAVVEDGNIVGFITSEVLIRVGMIWVHPKKRGSRKLVKGMIDEVRRSIPKDASVIAIGDHEIFKRYGMYEVEGKLWRIDL